MPSVDRKPMRMFTTAMVLGTVMVRASESSCVSSTDRAEVLVLGEGLVLGSQWLHMYFSDIDEALDSSSNDRNETMVLGSKLGT
eukprot:8054384-Alexandrium_andersonii.AAC.2